RRRGPPVRPRADGGPPPPPARPPPLRLSAMGARPEMGPAQGRGRFVVRLREREAPALPRRRDRDGAPPRPLGRSHRRGGQDRGPVASARGRLLPPPRRDRKAPELPPPTAAVPHP